MKAPRVGSLDTATLARLSGTQYRLSSWGTFMPNTTTDSQKSFSGTEFVWTKPGHAGAHEYLLPATLKALQSVNAHTVLDLGCGNGSCTAELSSRGFSAVGCDA